MMKHSGFILLFTLILCTETFSQSFNWAFRENAIEDQYIHAIELDQFDNIYLYGSFEDSLVIGDSTYASSYLSGNTSHFLAKYNAQREPVWVKVSKRSAIGGFGGYESHMNLDHQGNVYLLGRESNWLFINDSLYRFPFPGGTQNIESYFIKYDANGQFQWLKTWEIGELQKHTVSPDGSVLLSGSFTDSMYIDSTLYSAPGYNAYRAKISPQGDIEWLENTGVVEHYFYDSSESLYAFGNFEDSVKIGDTTLYSGVLGKSNALAGYITKLDTSRQIEWIKSFRLKDSLSLGRIDFAKHDGAGNLYFGGDQKKVIYLGQDSLIGDTVRTRPDRFAYVTKLDAQQNLLWYRTSDGWVNNFDVDTNGEVFIHGNYLVSIENVFGEIVNFSHHPIRGFGGFNVSIRPDGTPSWVSDFGKTVNTFPTISGFGRNSKGDVILSLESSRSSTDSLGHLIFPNSPAPITFLVASLNLNPSIISGTVFRDLNQNQVQDNGEEGLEDIFVRIDPDSFYVKTAENGFYQAFVDSGNYTVLVDSILHHQVSPAQYTVSLSGAGDIDSLNNFSFTPLPLVDLETAIIPLSPVRPGFLITYRLLSRNIGNESQHASISFSYDSLLNYENSTATPVQNGQTLSWDLDTLSWQEDSIIDVTFRLPPSTALASVLQLSTEITPLAGDADVANNRDTLFHTVTGSYDPNDKLVLPAGGISKSYIQKGNKLSYTLRFQNVGTDTAFNILIRDTLDTQLDLASVEILTASHPYNFEVSEEREMIFRFNDIRLQDSTSNEPESHGFIHYRVTPSQSLEIGDTIKNTAYIFFDYNQPIQTNTTQTPIQVFTTNIDKELEFSPDRLRIYPNPVLAMVHIHIDNPYVGRKAFQMQLFDASGKQIVNKEFSQVEFELDMTNLPKGLYVYKILQDGMPLETGKLLK